MSVQDVFATAGAIILSLGGGAALVFGLSSWLGKVWASRILETERHAMERAAFEHQTRFSWYHQRKAELIATLYALLNDVIEYTKQMVNPLQTADDTGREEHAKATFALYNRLATEYWGKKIFLEKDICEKVEAVITTTRRALIDFQVSQRAQVKNTELWGRAHESMETIVPPLLADLEDTFRKMLSVTNAGA